MAERREPTGTSIILCADDYAMTVGITRSIDELARARKISATSAMTTTRHWPEHGQGLRRLRGTIAIGLHFNLTLGRALGPMPKLATDGVFSRVGDVTRLAIGGQIDADEIAAEMTRQLDRFEQVCGYPPDFIDGHQHVHSLSGIRDGVFAALAARHMSPAPLIRDPGDSLAGIFKRGAAITKASALHWLSRGFRAEARRAGFAVNDSFAGVSDFDPARTERDFQRAAIGAGPLHLVMCHPGFPDAELEALDPITKRRRVEHDIIATRDLFGAKLWRPARSADGPAINWATALERAA